MSVVLSLCIALHTCFLRYLVLVCCLVPLSHFAFACTRSAGTCMGRTRPPARRLLLPEPTTSSSPSSAVPRLCLAISSHYYFFYLYSGSRRTGFPLDAGMHRIAFARARIRLSRVGRGATDTAGIKAVQISAEVSRLAYSFCFGRLEHS